MPAAVHPLTSLLIAAPEETPARDLAQQLSASDLRVLGAAACSNLVREVVRLAPEAVVLVAAEVDGALLDGVALLQAAQPVAVLLFCERFHSRFAGQAVAAGVLHVAAEACTPERLAVALPLALQQFAQLQGLQRTLAGLQARLDERKWVDRAKGVLMSRQQLTEPDAFALLRTASMQTNLRVGEVSRALIESAAAAEAVNRAGQLRMLSQRVVKALALHQAGVERALAETLLHDSLSRAQANVDHLAAMDLGAELQPLRAATLSSWQGLQARLDAGLAMPDLVAIDDDAQRLLDDAQRLTDALERDSGRRSLQVVNLSGRQRMLSQRVAKQALLASLLPDQAAQALAAAALASVAEFDAALLQLEQSPLASEEIRSTLAVARGQWQRMLDGVRQSSLRDGRVAVARESEALLQSFERLTSAYEHSMQVLLG